MDRNLRRQAHQIIQTAISAVQPDVAVRRALEGKVFPGRVLLVSVGKAAWQMAKAACDFLGDRVEKGIVLTKYGHVLGPIDNLDCREAGHPIPDENSFAGTRAVLDLVSDLEQQDTVIFLLSGGGSALFELPLIPGEELQDITGQLLSCGADIVEINTIRKRLSKVKGGRFAKACAPAQVYSIVLSDIVGDPLDMIASGPACQDSSTCRQAFEVVKKYDLRLSQQAMTLLQNETPKQLDNVTTCITGSVRELCRAAAAACRELGYQPVILTDQLTCQAKEAGEWLASYLTANHGRGEKMAFIAGGETVVLVTGTGMGGRNQELALSAAAKLDGLTGTCLFGVGSDGTDGPTDAAGGYVDYRTAEDFRAKDIDLTAMLDNNDAYHALQAVDGLIFTGPTGTNVNDVAVALLEG